MPDIKELIKDLASIPSVSGHEGEHADELRSLIGGYFDEYETDALGSQIFIKRRKKAPGETERSARILIDAHMDEIGMIVTGIEDGGFLRVANIGGLDTRILSASKVKIYGRETITGIVSSTPPHLQKKGDEKKLKPVGELLIDTGYPKEKLEKLVPLGTAVGFYPAFTDLLNECVAGKGFDDKSCAAAAVCAIASVPADKLAGDVYLLLSAGEEVNSAGAKTAAYRIAPDFALVLDVNLAKTPDTKKNETVAFCEGPSVSLSAVTDRALTERVIALAKERGVAFTVVAEASSTGTNANPLALVGAGIPCAVISLPLKSMHTCGEVISLDDAKGLCVLVATVISDEKTGKDWRCDVSF